MKVLVTGSCGLVGSAVVNYYVDTVGIDNDSRGKYFSFKLRYPNWEITMPLDAIIDEILYEFREVLV